MTESATTGEGQSSSVESSGSSSGEPAAATTQPSQDNRALAQMRKALAQKEKELEQIKANAMSEQEKAIAAAKSEGAESYRSKWMAAVAQNAAINALAAKGVVAPELALGAMDLSDIEIDATTGRVDPASLEAKVADVIKRYPMLTNSSGGQPTYATGNDQRRVGQSDLASAKPDDAKLNDMLRWALGGGKQPTA